MLDKLEVLRRTIEDTLQVDSVYGSGRVAKRLNMVRVPTVEGSTEEVCWMKSTRHMQGYWGLDGPAMYR